MLSLRDVSVFYNSYLALEKISLEVDTGTITGIIGPNGAGKSTLLKAILSILSHQGKIKIDEEETKKMLKKIAYVEQKATIDLTFPIKVNECVSLGTYPGMRIFQKPKKREWEKVTEALEKVNLLEYANHQIGELSGGQFQRVLVARCLVQNADYIFLDEPFVGIDSVSERIIMNTLIELKEQGKTILIVHHDLSKVKEYFDHVVILNKQLIVTGKVADVFNESNLKKAYGDTTFIDREMFYDSKFC